MATSKATIVHHRLPETTYKVRISLKFGSDVATVQGAKGTMRRISVPRGEPGWETLGELVDRLPTYALEQWLWSQQGPLQRETGRWDIHPSYASEAQEWVAVWTPDKRTAALTHELEAPCRQWLADKERQQPRTLTSDEAGSQGGVGG